jgi:flagellar hook-length control protein FliK
VPGGTFEGPAGPAAGPAIPLPAVLPTGTPAAVPAPGHQQAAHDVPDEPASTAADLAGQSAVAAVLPSALPAAVAPQPAPSSGALPSVAEASPDTPAIAATAATNALDPQAIAADRESMVPVAHADAAGSPAHAQSTDVVDDRPAAYFDHVAATVNPSQPVPQQPVTVAPAAADAAPAGSAAAAPQPQLAEALVHLRNRGGGTHELTVQLHPAELGAVHVRAVLTGDSLTVTVACADPAARHAVTAALPQLHQHLSESGYGGLDLNLSGGQPDDPRQGASGQGPSGQGPSGQGAPGQSARGLHAATPADHKAAPGLTVPRPAGARLDLRQDAIDRML